MIHLKKWTFVIFWQFVTQNLRIFAKSHKINEKRPKYDWEYEFVPKPENMTYLRKYVLSMNILRKFGHSLQVNK